MQDNMRLFRVMMIGLFLIQIFYSGCEFKPDEIDITQINPPDQQGPPIMVSLNEKNDTIKIGWPTNFTYKITGTDNEVISVIVTLDGQEIHHYAGDYEQSFNFILDPASLNEGHYHLHIEIMIETRSGSLADILDAEGYLYELDWPVIVDRTPPRKLNIISIDSLENGVKITWEKFDHPSFRSYKLTKTSSAFFGTDELLFQDDPSQNSFIDTTYLEGMIVNYYIELNGICSNLNCSHVNQKQYYQIPPKPEITYLRNFEVEVKWEPPSRETLLDFYYLHRSETTVSINEEDRISDPGIRTKSSTVSFGASNYFGLLYVPKLSHQVYPSNLLRGEADFIMGDEMPLCRYISLIRNSPSVLFSNRGRLYKYNLSSGMLTDSIDFSANVPDYFTISSAGNLFGYSENGKFITRTTLDFSQINILDNEEFANTSDNLLRYSLSNSGRLLTVLKDNTISVYDLETANRIAEKRFENLGWVTARISPDGNHILTEEYDNTYHIVYYEIIGDQIIETGRVDDSELYFLANIKDPFGPDSDIYIIYNEKVEIRDVSDFSIEKVIQIAGISYIDYQTMQAFGYDSGFIGSDLTYLYDLETGEVIKNLLVRYMNIICFHNDYLIANNGRKLNMNSIN